MGTCQDPNFYLEKTLELNPKHAGAALLKGKSLIKSGQFTNAIQFLVTFLKQENNCPRLKNLLATAYIKADQLEIAEDLIDNALIQFPRTSELLWSAFYIKKSRGDQFSALHFLERIVRIDDNDATAFWEMANLMDSPSNLSQRVNALEIAYSLQPDCLKIYQSLIVSYCECFETNEEKYHTLRSIKTLEEAFLNIKRSKLPLKIQVRAQSIIEKLKIL